MLDLDAIFGAPAQVTGPARPVPAEPPPLDADAADQPVVARLLCSGCKRPLDAKARCWRCNHRLCSRCGRDTGSAFIELCIVCDFGGRE